MQAWGGSKQTVHPYDFQDLHVGAPVFIRVYHHVLSCSSALFPCCEWKSLETSTAVAVYLD